MTSTNLAQSKVSASSAPPPQGEFVFSQSDFARIAALLRSETGIHLPASKENLVYTRLSRRLRTLGFTSFSHYCDFVSARGGEDERQQMCRLLTTNVTKFFREPHHFEHLKGHVLPDLLNAARAGRRVRFWSAACSSGEEPYSIALSVLSIMPDAAKHDIRILATDINSEVVEKGRQGIYSESDLVDVPSELRRRWFSPVSAGGSNQVQASEALRQLVAFKELNLIGPWPMKGSFDAIFCRNVAIYFDEKTSSQLWRQLAQQLSIDGHLYIGHSERILNASNIHLRPGGVTVYQKTGANFNA